MTCNPDRIFIAMTVKYDKVADILSYFYFGTPIVIIKANPQR